MPATLEELTRFQDFAAKRLASDESELSMQQLLDLWRIDNPDAEELQESVSSIKEALEDWDQGDRGMPYEDHIRELKAQIGMADE